MSSPRLATATRLPPTSCCICFEVPSLPPGWERDGVLVCERCCRATHALLRTADAARLAEVWFVGRALLEERSRRAEDVGAHSEAAADLALALSQMGLRSDAVPAAILAARHGDETVWARVIGILLGGLVADAAFTDALRHALSRSRIE